MSSILIKTGQCITGFEMIYLICIIFNHNVQ